MERNLLIKKYCEVLDCGEAAVFVGAGMSAGAGFVQWSGLLKDAAEELNYTIDDHTDLVALAQYYVNETKDRMSFFNAIKKNFPGGTTPLENHKVLASLPIKTYWTTNYDHLIEDALLQEGKKIDIKKTVNSLSVSSGGSDAIVNKMHGDIDDPTTCILTRDDFENYDQTHKAFLDNLMYDLRNKTFLFLGLSFEDPNLHTVFSYVRKLCKDNRRRHYYITKIVSQNSGESVEAFEQRKREQSLFVEDLKNYGISTCLIDDYAYITKILSQIKSGYQRRSVFLSGAATFYDPLKKEDVNTFIRNLSAALIHEGFRLVNGYGLGFGNEVIAGALGQLQNDNKAVDGNLLICPFPQGDKKLKSYWTKLREDLISHTGISIFLFGNKKDGNGNRIDSNGMREEYDISKEHGNLLIPVGATGDMALKLWNDQMNELSSSHIINKLSPSVDDMNNLKDTKSLNGLLKVIINIVKKALLN